MRKLYRGIAIAALSAPLALGVSSVASANSNDHADSGAIHQNGWVKVNGDGVWGHKTLAYADSDGNLYYGTGGGYVTKDGVGIYGAESAAWHHGN